MMRFLLSFLLLLPASALAQNYQYNTPGSYVLPADSTSTGMFNIRINSSNVSLNLNGRTVTCAPANKGTAITFGIHASGMHNVRIFNGRITGCYMGIYVGGSNVVIEDIDFTGTAYIGINAPGSTGLIVRDSIFADIEGYSVEPYAIGINAPGNNCLIERNVFRNLYRQPGYVGTNGGEGVGVLHNASTSGCTVRWNWFENDGLGDPDHLDIGVWTGSHATATVAENTFTGFPRAIFTYQTGTGHVVANDNRLWLREEQAGSLGISAATGSATGNLIVGFETPLAGVTDDGGNVILP